MTEKIIFIVIAAVIIAAIYLYYKRLRKKGLTDNDVFVRLYKFFAIAWYYTFLDHHPHVRSIASGTILKRTQYGSRLFPLQDVRYSFKAWDNKTYEGTVLLEMKDWGILDGTPLRIAYSNVDPKINVVDNDILKKCHRIRVARSIGVLLFLTVGGTALYIYDPKLFFEILKGAGHLHVLR